MAGREINGKLKAALEYGPLIAFFAGYFLLKDRVFTIGGTDYAGFIIVTAFFVPLMALTTWLQYRLSGSISRMQVLTLVLVVIFGGLTVWLNDERFIKMKPTLFYVIAGGLLGIGLLRGRSYLRTVMGELIPLRDEGWMILTRRFTAFFFALAVLNEVIWRSMSTEIWVTFKTFGLTAAVFVFFIAQGRLFQKYGTRPGE